MSIKRTGGIKKEKIEPASYQDLLIFYTFKDTKMACVLTPYQDGLVLLLLDIQWLHNCSGESWLSVKLLNMASPNCLQRYSVQQIYF